MRLRRLLIAALLLGTGFTLAAPAGRTVAAAEQCFPETGRCIGGLFYDYWLANGGLAQQGLPLTAEFDEVNPTNGRAYRVQYFERARFELHPENAGTPYEVLLGLLGREQFLAKYPDGRPTGADGDDSFGVTGRLMRVSLFENRQGNGSTARQ